MTGNGDYLTDKKTIIEINFEQHAITPKTQPLTKPISKVLLSIADPCYVPSFVIDFFQVIAILH